MDLVSIVVPFLNEESCILKYCDFIDCFSEGKPFEVEVVFVDDGSTDSTSQVISSYEFKNCKSVKLITLSKNFGAHAALRAGIFHASGDYTTYAGADLQEPEDMVSVMYENIKNGKDAVYIEKRSNRVNFVSRLFSSFYSSLIRRYAVKNFGKGGFNNIMFNDKIKQYLNSNIEANSSLILQIVDAGFKNAIVKMDYNARSAGVSKWTFSKKTKLFIDSFVAFSFAPIRFVSIMGISMSLIGFLYGFYIVISRFWVTAPVPGYATLAVLLLFGFGITNISLGIIAEYLWRTFAAASNRPVFVVSEVKDVRISES